MCESFDNKAATWDDNPRRQALARILQAAIAETVPFTTADRVLDFGCGTGLLGLALAPKVATVLGVDTAPAMVDRFNAKAHAANLDRARAEVRDLLIDPLPPASVDLIVSAMTFHHVVEVEATLATLAATLVPGGHLAIADLVHEDGSYHDHPVPHDGFDPAHFADALRAAGLTVVVEEVVHIIRKEHDDTKRDYPVFLAIARRDR